MTPSVTSVESSEQFWRKIHQIWRICEPWSLSSCTKLDNICRIMIKNLTEKKTVKILLLGHSITEKIIFQHQQFVWSYTELLETVRIPSSVMRFAVTCSLWASGKNIGQENHLLSPSIYKVMNIHTWRPGMNCAQGHHFPQFLEQFCSLIKNEAVNNSKCLH